MRQRSGTGMLTRGSHALGGGTWAGSIGGSWYSKGAVWARRRSMAVSALSSGLVGTGDDWACTPQHTAIPAIAASANSRLTALHIRFARCWR